MWSCGPIFHPSPVDMIPDTARGLDDTDDDDEQEIGYDGLFEDDDSDDQMLIIDGG